MSTLDTAMRVTGWRCAVCDRSVPIAAPLPWRCPGEAGDRRHVLHLERTPAPLDVHDDPHPLLAYDRELAWAAFADAHGLDATRRRTLVEGLDRALGAIGSVPFARTPTHRADRLSQELGFSARGGVWVKDETGNVAGSHKARHLVTILLHLLAAEECGSVPWARGDRPPLAIASCGNAALAAGTLAAAARWPIRVFVPPSADTVVLAELARLGAVVVECPRRGDDPPGDPCIHRFREAVAAGAVPFSVQGPENALCLDGGRVLGWELLEVVTPDRLFVQVGGGAFVASVGAALTAAGATTVLHAVQTEGCAPLERAWRAAPSVTGGRAAAGRHWAELMHPWDQPPHSLADGILDDETYDWLGAFAAMGDRGSPVVATEEHVRRAYELAHATTAIDVSPTGSAGLAGLLQARDRVGDDERVAVVFSGVRRGTPRPAGVA